MFIPSGFIKFTESLMLVDYHTVYMEYQINYVT